MVSSFVKRLGFTLIELLVVISIIAVLAAILFPVFGRAKDKAKQATCLSNMRQIGLAFGMYLDANNDVLPDRRDLKLTLPGGWKPWASWPTSDPRAGWAMVALGSESKSNAIWQCTSSTALFKGVIQVTQSLTTQLDSPSSNYWLWRFDRIDQPVPLDNFWGKTPAQTVEDLKAANNPQAGIPEGEADVELLVDSYFPKTIPTVAAELKGKSVHFGGRNRLFLDSHAKFFRDSRTD